MIILESKTINESFHWCFYPVARWYDRWMDSIDVGMVGIQMCCAILAKTTMVWLVVWFTGRMIVEVLIIISDLFV